MLGKPEPVSLEDIFTDVYLLDRPTAMQRFDIETLNEQQSEQDNPFSYVTEPISALRLARDNNRLFILGKPGAGKTTLSRYLTLQAATSKLDRVMNTFNNF